MTLNMSVKVMMYNMCSSGIRWQIHDFVSDCNSIVCYISHHLRYIHKSRKFQNLDLQNEGQGVEEQDLLHSTGNVWVCIGEFFQNFSYLATYVYAKGNTHTGMTIGKIYRMDLRKNSVILLATWQIIIQHWIYHGPLPLVEYPL